MAYAYSRSITIDGTRVLEPLSNFPVFIGLTNTSFALTSNGGRVQNSNGYDIAYYSDKSLSSQLAHESEVWKANTGQIAHWVKLPTVSASSNTIFYVAYGDSGISVSQENTSSANGVWTNNFRAVYHMHISGNQLNSSGIGAIGLTASSTPAPQYNQSGQCGSASFFASGASWCYQQNLSYSPFGSTAVHVTLTAWWKWSGKTGSLGNIAEVNQNGNYRNTIYIYTGPSGSIGGAASMHVPFFHTSQDPSYENAVPGIRPHTRGLLTASQWCFIAGVGSGSTFRYCYYGNGTDDFILTGTGSSTSVTPGILAGTTIAYADETGRYQSTGSIDEVRFVTGARSLNWLRTEYWNQYSPGTFFTLGGESGAPGTVVYYTTYNPIFFAGD